MLYRDINHFYSYEQERKLAPINTFEKYLWIKEHCLHIKKSTNRRISVKFSLQNEKWDQWLAACRNVIQIQDLPNLRNEFSNGI